MVSINCLFNGSFYRCAFIEFINYSCDLLYLLFQKHKFEWKSFFITGIISLILLGGIQNIMIPKIVKFAADFEIFFVNKLGMGFNIGSAFYFILLFVALTGLILFTVKKKESYFKFGFYTAILFAAIAVISGASYGIGTLFTRALVLGGFLYGINYLKTKNINTLNVILVSFTTLIIGYSSFFIVIIRSQANTPMDENDPENAITMLSYLNREQYGDWPLTYGQYYNAPTDRANFKDGEPVYAKDEVAKNIKLLIVERIQFQHIKKNSVLHFLVCGVSNQIMKPLIAIGVMFKIIIKQKHR